jgi:TATA-binding protein-associated factor
VLNVSFCRQLLEECGIGGATTTESDNDPAAMAVGAVSQHRALIFCQLKPMLDIIENDLLKSLPTVSYLRMDGSVDSSKRHEMVQKFNADPSIDVLLLTTHVGGLGLNLTGADTVIFVEHDWNPMKDLQAMDRAHRIGQKKVVNVYRLITRGTLEEKIMGLQKFKLNIANSIVNQQNSGLHSMDTDQILDLFNVSKDDESSISHKKKIKNADGVSADGLGNAKAVLENLETLWDDKEYEEEYNIDSFISSLN